MQCWHCSTALIWGADHELEDDEVYVMVTNLSCPECGAAVDVYLPRGDES
jgi:RNase P subunit RPR2